MIQDKQVFAGSSRCVSLDSCPSGIAIIGAPHCVLSEPQPELLRTDRSPSAIRHASHSAFVSSDLYDFDLGGSLTGGRATSIVDCGDVPGSPCDPSGNRTRITEAVAKVLHRGATPMVMGGDDSVPIAVLEAFEGFGPVTIIQIDAHLDWRDEYRGVRYGHGSTMRRISELPWIDGIVQVGMHGVGGATHNDYTDAQSWGARITPASIVHKRGVDYVVEQVPERSRIFITLDCDGIDSGTLPAATYPMPGGLFYHQIIDLIDGLSRKGHIIGCDVVELAPEKDTHGMSALVIARVMLNLIGRVVRSRPQGE